MRSRAALAVLLALSVPAAANPVVRTGPVAESAGRGTPLAPTAAPAFSAPLVGAAPSLSLTGSLPSPALPTPRGAAASAQAAPAAALAAPAAANGVQASGLLGPDGRSLARPEAANHAAPRPALEAQPAAILTGTDVQAALQTAVGQGRGRQAGGRAAPAALDALFDGKAGLPLDLSQDGLKLNGLFRLLMAPPPGAGLEAARAELRAAVAAARPVAAKAVSARTLAGRPMTLDDPCCGVAAPIFGALLRRAEVPVDVVEAETHVYLLRRLGGELLVVDPSIRQFFGGAKAPAEIPTVFIGTFGELSALFERHVDAKTTAHDVTRIYRSEAAIKNALLGEALDLARDSGREELTASLGEAADDATYAPLRRALRLAPTPKAANGVSEAAVPAPDVAAPTPWWRAAWEFFFPPLKPDPAWDAVKGAVGPELAKLRAMPKAERAAYLRGVGEQVVTAVKKLHKTEEIGFHYNLHGGRPDQYLEGGGIKATMGNIAIQYDMNADRAYKVYMFRSSEHNLYDLLSERHPNLISSRMGDVLIPFRLDSGFLRQAFITGLARNPTAISIDFDEGRLPKMIGIPKDTFLSEPLLVFDRVSTRLDAGRLSRDEETLAVMRYLEAALGAAPQTYDEKYQRVGRSRVERSAWGAKYLLDSLADENHPVLFLSSVSREEVVVVAPLAEGIARGHHDLLPQGADASDMRGFSMWLLPDGSVRILGSGTYPGPLTPGLERALRRAVGLKD
ncbi:MAG: hypothetical protein HYZ75_09710 [Elusimicrobia bacterium]|nr:hypothetical protein [Elusimicrobiota bacterium]